MEAELMKNEIKVTISESGEEQDSDADCQQLDAQRHRRGDAASPPRPYDRPNH